MKWIYNRFVKNIQVYKPGNISFSRNVNLCNGCILDARTGRIAFGRDVRIGNSCEIIPGKGLGIQIKDYSSMYGNTRILGNVTIGRYGLLSSNIYISSGNHTAFWRPELPVKLQDALFAMDNELNSHDKPVEIHEDVWIGNGVFISQGITVGRGAVIGANSVVTENVAPYSVVVGAPAKEIRKRFDFVLKSDLNSANENDWPYFYEGFDHMLHPGKRSIEGMRLVDNGILLLSGSARGIVLSGKTDKAELLQITVNGYSRDFQINSGDFECRLSDFPVNPEETRISLVQSKSAKRKAVISILKVLPAG